MTRIVAPLADVDAQRTSIEGVAIIECQDIYGDVHLSYQQFYGWYHKGSAQAVTVMTTFGDELPAKKAQVALKSALKVIADIQAATLTA